MDNWFYNCKIEKEIINSDKQSFEDLFCRIMKANDDKFQKVKANGIKGDEKCDGFNSNTGEYYCVYAPEDFSKEYTINNGITKIKKDIEGIIEHWENIKKIFYVINDKFRGLPSGIQKIFIELQQNKTYPPIEIFSMEYLKTLTISLSEEKKQELLGFVPDLSNSVTTLQFDIIENVIKYLEKNVKLIAEDGKIIVPDYSKKIEYNHLSEQIKDLLNVARYQIDKVDKFFEYNPVYDKETLRDYCNSLYLKSCQEISESVENYSDKRFVFILDAMSYNKQSQAVANNIIIIMANFFESCDIFEEPMEEV